MTSRHPALQAPHGVEPCARMPCTRDGGGGGVLRSARPDCHDREPTTTTGRVSTHHTTTRMARSPRLYSAHPPRTPDCLRGWSPQRPRRAGHRERGGQARPSLTSASAWAAARPGTSSVSRAPQLARCAPCSVARWSVNDSPPPTLSDAEPDRRRAAVNRLLQRVDGEGWCCSETSPGRRRC